VVDEQVLRHRWLELTRERLPARARAERWPLRHDHCFQRVLLDQVCGGRWYDHVDGRPAYRRLDAPRLRAAVELAERLEREGEPLLRRLDEDSLRWRGKTRTAR
jgi:hypothetical protein